MRHRLGMFAVMAALGLCACNAPPGSYVDPGDDDAGEPPADAAGEAEDPAIRFAASKEAAEAGDYKDEFGLLDQRDIIAVFDVPDARGVQFIKFDILNPHGVRHQTIWRAISSDSDPPEAATHPELSQEIPVTRVEPEAGSARVQIAIPIAGTDFTQFRLTGTFTVQAWAGMGDDEPWVTGSFTMVK